MRETRLTCDRFNFIDILEVIGRKAANEHATLCVRGHIAADSDDYVIHSSAGQGITFTAMDWEGEKKLFSGIISEINIHTENEIRILTLNMVSQSSLMDLDLNTRTFQDDNMTYSAVTSRMAESNPSFNFLWPQNGDTPIGSMTVQYRETDWNYAIRLASRLGTVVIPDYLLDTPYISIGIPNRAQRDGIRVISHTTQRNLQAYRQALPSNRLTTPSRNFEERDALTFVVKSRDIFDLCDKIIFEGLPMLVYAIDTRYEGSELVHYYTLKEADGFFTPRIFNDDLSGVSLHGIVREIMRDQVRVNVNDDVSQTTHKWFPYATPFTQPDGQGWYFMPEVGDEIRLQFSNEKEDECYVLSAVHITHGNRVDPQVKFIRTIYGQIIQFDPGQILIDDGAGSSVTLDRRGGISMRTDKTTRVDAQAEIVLSASGSVVLSGGNSVVLQKGASIVRVDSAIDMSSTHTRTQ